MSQPLGKVTGDLDAARGPDVELQIQVPEGWMGASVAVELPRNLNCASCQGGGCDRCERAGALSLRGRDEAATEVVVALPTSNEAGDAGVCLRIPERGARSTEESEGRGHLLLKVRIADEASSGVSLMSAETNLTPEQERLQMIRRSSVMAVGLILLFIGLLRLSGWL